MPQGERTTVAIREDTRGRILLTGLHQVDINSADDLLRALNFGSSIRQTDATAINAKSSRSHAVFSLNLIQRKNTAPPTPAQEKRFSVPIETLSGAENWVTVDSKLHFVDLAGSERLKNTGASGDRAREGISINAGLASLGKVISQLSSRQSGSHVSYRDSKLTRLLQDSLGGNAITYMIACVTTAEFHLSETLNTVQYAQRARAIQSKPQIHQVSDESDKQAVIDRLRAEVSFLRDQISSTERGDRRSNGMQDRVERHNEREIELQNDLLNVQENYTALGQRHAKLISEITKARDDEPGETPTLSGAIGDSAVERLKRSNSFAEAVEQVVLEYEKTIQSLESSLSATRSSLATTESSLMEKESKFAYVETVNQQLQNRLQKMMDRESSTERYLHDLESKLDGHSSGEEKSSTVVTELRKEIARIRENEASCEEYISTLEERLAESDQDMELMQREVDRLEHVVERQRSLGKLDNLLYEFDHVIQNGNPLDPKQSSKTMTNGFIRSANGTSSERALAESTLEEAAGTPIPGSDDEDWERLSDVEPGWTEDGKGGSKSINVPVSKTATPGNTSQQSPAQTEFVADKLEIVTRELVDLRVEHESTVTELDMMSAKYEEALRTLAELQDSVDEARHSANLPNVTSPASTRPTSFLGDARVSELKDGEHLPSSRSLSSELSLDGDSASSVEPSPGEAHLNKLLRGNMNQTLNGEETLAGEVDQLKMALLERDEALAIMNDKYSQMEVLHLDTLDIVEELKAEVTKAKMNPPSSPTTPVIRRKGSVMTIDRAHRSLASLKNIAADNFEDKPDTMQNFELNLNTAMHELHQRSERVQVLEAELVSLRKEMESKATMISGLTRERSSLKSSPIDISVVSTMHAQLQQNEEHIRSLQETHAAREQELVGEIESLRSSLNEHVETSRSAMPGFFPETPAPLEQQDKQLGQPREVERLQGEMSALEKKHQAAIQTMQASEKNFIATITELEASLANVIAMHGARIKENEANANKADHENALDTLPQDIDEYKTAIGSHVQRIAELEQMHAATHEEIEDAARYKSTTQDQLVSRRDRISLLENQIQEHQSAVEFHKHGLKSLHDSHARELQDVRTTLTAAKTAEMEARLEEATREAEMHRKESSTRLNTEIDGLKSQLEEQKAFVAKQQAQFQQLTDQLRAAKDLVTEKQEQLEEQLELSSHKEEQRRISQSVSQELEQKVASLSASIEQVSGERDRATRLVEELEEQISTSYDHQRATTSRLSVLSSGRDQALLEASMAKVKLEEDLEDTRSRLEAAEVSSSFLATMNENSLTMVQNTLRSYIDGQHQERSNSLTSNMRKTVSVASLPSPPPAIPLPPLPTSVPNTLSSIAANALPTSPTNANYSPEPAVSNQYAEEQEARIRTIEKHLFAEKQLTATLEEALVDLEHQGKKVRSDMDVWKKKAWAYEDELAALRKERNSTRHSLQAVEEERIARKEAEAGVARLEERMQAMNKKKTKKGSFNCF